MVVLYTQRYFLEKRFRYLTDWGPSRLAIPVVGGFGRLPIHWPTNYSKDIGGFRTAIEVGLRHFPAEIRLLFRKYHIGNTSYQMACHSCTEMKKLIGPFMVFWITIQWMNDDLPVDRMKILMFAALRPKTLFPWSLFISCYEENRTCCKHLGATNNSQHDYYCTRSK